MENQPSTFKKTALIYFIKKLIEKENLALNYLCNSTDVREAVRVVYGCVNDPSNVIQNELIRITKESIPIKNSVYLHMLLNEEDSHHAKWKSFDDGKPQFEIYNNMYHAWNQRGLGGVICYICTGIPLKQTNWETMRSYDPLTTEIKKEFLNDLLKKLLTVKTI